TKRSAGNIPLQSVLYEKALPFWSTAYKAAPFNKKAISNNDDYTQMISFGRGAGGVFIFLKKGPPRNKT
ncbi:MAG: hypothetical protein IJC54_01140, partial [Clostridia bacterium]|nr:hypothetical protein [Clostridia bacterium]